jgi:Uma2 family endonuclease
MLVATITETAREWTVGDLLRKFGPIPIRRIRQVPAPGTATEEDVLEIQARENRLCELVDGVLVEKTMGWLEAYLALEIGAVLRNHVRPLRIGVVVGADGMYRLNPGLIRIPDVSFLSVARVPNRRLPNQPICPLIPNLAVEVLSESNTRKEMAEKLADYFGCGVELVWYVDPKRKTVRVFTAPDASRLLRESHTLDGGDVLPGFALPLRDLFADPMAEPAPEGDAR